MAGTRSYLPTLSLHYPTVDGFKVHIEGAVSIGLAVEAGGGHFRQHGMGKGQRDDADGDTQHGDERLKLELHEVAPGNLEVVEKHIQISF